MATLSKHGHEVARFDYLKFSASFRSDGTILTNHGDGWKLAKLRDGCTFEGALATCREKEAKRSRAFLDYRAAVISEFPLAQRLIYLELSDLLDGDIDGLWSSLEDAGIHVDLETLQWIHRLKEAVKASKGKALVS